MKAAGKTTNNTVTESRSGLKAPSTQAITTCHRRKGWGSISMRTDRRMRGSGWRIRSVDLESISGKLRKRSTVTKRAMALEALISISALSMPATPTNSTSASRTTSQLCISHRAARIVCKVPHISQEFEEELLRHPVIPGERSEASGYPRSSKAPS